MNQITEPSKPLPIAWIERLFERLSVMYGNKFIDLWRGLDLDSVKRAWAEDLAGLTTDELKRGLDACKREEWPPTLPQFINLCRPQRDTRADWAEACEQMRIRLKGQGGDTWSRPQVYWAAVAIGNFDLNQVPWEQIRPRWEKALADAKTGPIPEYRAALPQPGQATTSREEASKRLHEIAEKTGISISTNGVGNVKWAVRLAEREASGESLSAIQKSYWREALGVSHVTSAKDVIEEFNRQKAA